MNKLDEKIREALEEVGVDGGELGEEDSLRSMIGDAYVGRLRWLLVLMSVLQLVFTAVFVWAGVRFFGSVTSTEPLFWATIFLITGLVVSMIKVMHWMMINRNRLLREVKRLELEVARLGKRLETPGA
jgi:hypothetical protein